jgi:hypothetical protein
MNNPFWFFREPYVYLIPEFACFSVGLASMFAGEAPMREVVYREKTPISFWFIFAPLCVGGIWMIGYCLYQVAELSH